MIREIQIKALIVKIHQTPQQQKILLKFMRISEKY